MYDGRPLKAIWTKSNKKKYENMGYIFTQYGDVFYVNYTDALSRTKIITTCDYCGKEIEQDLKTYKTNKERSFIQKDACVECWSEKLKETMIKKHGVKNASNLSYVVEKRTQTFIDRLGVSNPLRLESVKEKIKATNLEKYGYEHMMQIPGEALRRIELACKTMYERGNGVTSFQQNHINSVLEGNLNYPVGAFKLDIAFPEKMIYIEYDGSGHNLQVILGNKTQQEVEETSRKRYYTLKNKDWKMIRIISSNDKLPNDDILRYYFLLACAKFKYFGHNYFELNLDEMTYKYAGETNPVGFIKTKRIIKE